LVAGQLKKGKKSDIARENLKDEKNQKLKKKSNDPRQQKKHVLFIRISRCENVQRDPPNTHPHMVGFPKYLF